MGHKSRGNWNINFCLKFNCLNRGVKCEECIFGNEFKDGKSPHVEIIDKVWPPSYNGDIK